jgi:hypothetical protein
VFDARCCELKNCFWVALASFVAFEVISCSATMGMRVRSCPLSLLVGRAIAKTFRPGIRASIPVPSPGELTARHFLADGSTDAPPLLPSREKVAEGRMRGRDQGPAASYPGGGPWRPKTWPILLGRVETRLGRALASPAGARPSPPATCPDAPLWRVPSSAPPGHLLPRGEKGGRVRGAVAEKVSDRQLGGEGRIRSLGRRWAGSSPPASGSRRRGHADVVWDKSAAARMRRARDRAPRVDSRSAREGAPGAVGFRRPTASGMSKNAVIEHLHGPRRAGRDFRNLGDSPGRDQARAARGARARLRSRLRATWAATGSGMPPRARRRSATATASAWSPV